MVYLVRTVIAVPLILFAVIGCTLFWPYNPDLSVNRKLESVLNNYYADRTGVAPTIYIQLDQVTDFDWDVVHILGHYAGCLSVIEAIGFWVHACHMLGNDFYNVLIFENDGKRVKYSNVKNLRSPGPVMTVTREEAKFESIQSLRLAGRFLKEEREGIYVRWLFPPGRSQLYCTFCVKKSRHQERCWDPDFVQDKPCDIDGEYDLRVVPPNLGRYWFNLDYHAQKIQNAKALSPE